MVLQFCLSCNLVVEQELINEIFELLINQYYEPIGN
jgi:hypothetical protein